MPPLKLQKFLDFLVKTQDFSCFQEATLFYHILVFTPIKSENKNGNKKFKHTTYIL